MVYSIAYDVKDADRVQQLMDRVNQLGDNIQYLSNAILLQKEGTSANAIYDELRKITIDEDRILVSQIDKNRLMGWLSSNAVNWIINHN
jgi:CRISPR/Cas system-associated endoribonuclease Cas2